ncbi:DUF4340 domain-containing protein [Nevskia sp.]|uniref:DUF4340 domain-containing protein n=1 Tax=Nevskia sp. TaxID=1929292 RepID=UPI0025F25103|nr:DUF4340 domain-containing protein [Nevskia sp.]
MKQIHLNLLLVAVAAGLFWLLVLDENKEEAKIAKAIERQPPLTTLDANAIRRIRLKNSASPDIVLEKSDYGWQMREPVAVAADLVQIGNLTALATLETRGSIDTKVAKRPDLGLDPARSTVLLDDIELGIGEIEPLKRTRYIELSPGSVNNRISLVDDFAPEVFDGEYTDLINKALLPFDAQIARIEVPGLVLARDTAGTGWTATPASALATPDAMDQLANAWRDVRALATVPPLTSASPTSKADVAVTLADGSRIGYKLIDKADSRFLQRLDVPVSYQFVPAEVARLLSLMPPPPAEEAEPEAEAAPEAAAP